MKRYQEVFEDLKTEIENISDNYIKRELFTKLNNLISIRLNLTEGSNGTERFDEFDDKIECLKINISNVQKLCNK